MSQSEGQNRPNGKSGRRGLSGFVVVARCVGKDIPIGMFATLDDACNFGDCLTHRSICEMGRWISWYGQPSEPAAFELRHVVAVEFRNGMPMRSGRLWDADDLLSGFGDPDHPKEPG
jgi:hypothetical protein